jgi:hypothetical protein
MQLLAWATVQLLAKSCVLLVICVCSQNNDLGGRQGNAMQALARWQHPVASSTASNVLHWAMHPALYRRIRMAIEIASGLPAFFIVLNFIVGHNRS